MIGASTLSLRDIVGTSQEGSKTRRTASRHQAERIYQLCSIQGFAFEDSILVFGKDSGGRNTSVSLCLEAVVRSNNRFPTVSELDPNESYGVLPFASHFQMIPQDPRGSQGMRPVHWDAEGAGRAIVEGGSRMVVVVPQCSAAALACAAAAAPFAEP